MAKQAESPSPVVTDIIAGHFNHRDTYSTFRTHGSEDWLIIYTASGFGRFGYGSSNNPRGQIITRPGDIALLRPGTLHDYGLEETRRHWELLWAHFQPRPAWHELLAWPPAQTGWPGLMLLHLDKSARRKIRDRMLDVDRLANGAQRQRGQFAMNALEEVLLWCDAINPRKAGAIDARIHHVMDHVCGDLRHLADIQTLADLAGLSVSRFAHLFRESVGLPPQQWVEMQRMNRARQLLELTSMPIKQIARDVGFDNALYFSLRFSKWVGKSPRGFRSRS